MKRIILPLVLFLCTSIFFSCNNVDRKDVASLMAELDADVPLNSLTATEKDAGWNLLFDGESLDGWRGFNLDKAPDCWRVEDGILKIINAGGAESAEGIITDRKFSSFALSVDFKLTAAANSGILYHVGEDAKYTYAYETGTEYQLIDQDGWPDPLEDWQITSANYAMHPPKTKPFKPLGEWNHALLIVDGNNVTHVLNGEVTVEFEKYSDEWVELRNSGKWSDYPDYGKFDEGHICLQNHGTIVHFKNIKIKEL